MDTRDCRLCPVAPRPAWCPCSGSDSGSGHGTSSSGRRPLPSVLPAGSATAQPLGVAGCFPVYWFPLFMGDAIPNPKERKPGLLWECQWQCPSLEVIPLGAGARGPFVSSGRPGDTEVWELLCSVLTAKGEVRGGQASRQAFHRPWTFGGPHPQGSSVAWCPLFSRGVGTLWCLGAAPGASQSGLFIACVGTGVAFIPGNQQRAQTFTELDDRAEPEAGGRGRVCCDTVTVI